VTRHLASLVDVWRDVASTSDGDLASQIVEDRIDVLVDLTMHMSDGRPLLFARRPAPVQVSWLAYPGTTGSAAISYRLTDPWLDPIDDASADDRYSERSVRLPETFWCYDPLVAESAVDALPVDSNGWITFGCLNHPKKLTPHVLSLWARVLGSVADSRLIVLAAPGNARESLTSRFSMLGVDPSRLTFVGYQPRDAYLRTFGQIDIALDTFPYNGHTTTLEGLWSGVPVVSKIGSTPVSRAGHSILTNLGLSEFATHTDDEFVDSAVRLARDLPRLRKLRAELRRRMEQSPLMDGARFAGGMERAFRWMWERWCQS
jgi:protein O-GlcNAc transferase